MTRIVLLVLAPTTVALAAPPKSMVLRYNQHALYGNVDARSKLYPSDLTPDGYSIGDSVEVDFDRETGPYWLRLSLDESMIPPAGRAALRVGVSQKQLLWGWRPARKVYLQRGPAGVHSVYVRIDEPGHYGMVAAERTPRSFLPVLRQAVADQIAYVLGRPATDLTDAHRADFAYLGRELGVDLGKVRLLASKDGLKAERLRRGMLAFFRLDEGAQHAVVVADSAILTGALALDDPKARRHAIAEVALEVMAQRRDPEYIDRWVRALAIHGWTRHPVHVDRDRRARALERADWL